MMEAVNLEDLMDASKKDRSGSCLQKTAQAGSVTAQLGSKGGLT